MIPPPPTNHRSWDAFLDAFEARAGRTHYLDELVAAVWCQALGLPEPEPFTAEEIKVVSARNSKTLPEEGDQVSLFEVLP
jgi:hypothetical protein